MLFDGRDQAAVQVVERAWFGVVEQEHGVGRVGIVRAGGQQHRLALGVRLARQAMRQEGVVAVAPEPAVQVFDPGRIRRAHQGPPAAGEGLAQEFRKRLVQPGALQVIEPDLAGAHPVGSSS